MAAGSTNITSDYDVTMAGPRASELAAHINGKFFRDTGHSLSTYADTNLYFNPWVLITNNNFHRFAENFIHVPRPDEEDLYLPFPKSDALQTKDRSQAHWRLSKSRCNCRQSGPQTDLYLLAKQIETAFYTNDGSVVWETLIDLLHESQRLQPDITLSSLAVVVVEMLGQGAKLGLDAHYYETCALENIACMAEHGLFTDRDVPQEVEKLVGTIKYLYRVVYSLQNADTTAITEETVAMLHNLNLIRGNVDFLGSDTYATYLEQLPGILCICEAFRQRCGRREFSCISVTTENDRQSPGAGCR